jgi:hypothetical protein
MHKVIAGEGAPFGSFTWNVPCELTEEEARFFSLLCQMYFGTMGILATAHHAKVEGSERMLRFVGDFLSIVLTFLLCDEDEDRKTQESLWDAIIEVSSNETWRRAVDSVQAWAVS